MIISFSVENFRSFKAEETLNLLASKRLGDAKDSPHCTEMPRIDEHALRIAAFYGANGAGKSNFLRALHRMKELVLSGSKPGEKLSYNPFLLDQKTPQEPTAFDLQFLADGEVFRYGISYDAERIRDEWLDVYKGKKETNLFTRTLSESGTVEIRLGPAIGNDLKKIKALAEVGSRANQLFLTEIVNLDDSKAQGPLLKNAINWFKYTLQIIEPGAEVVNLPEKLASDNHFAEFASRFLREASTGIAGLNVTSEKISRDDYSKTIPKTSSMSFDQMADYAKLISEGEEMKGHLSVAVLDKDSIMIQQIASLHLFPDGNQFEFLFEEESDGSQRLLNLLPALYQLAYGTSVFVIDELERSMHPMLARKFIEYFLKSGPQTKSQLIFTTHESTLLDLDLMRRDEIWFAEKDIGGASHLYSLADFKVRNDLRIEKGYLQGRFGAIPFLGGIDQMLKASTDAEVGA